MKPMRDQIKIGKIKKTKVKKKEMI